jgi:hypothetical protein
MIKVRFLSLLLEEIKMKKNITKILILILFGFMLHGCSDADIASHNLSKAADMFEINRRIVFYNGITADYILVLEGRCSLGNCDKEGELTVTCKTGPDTYKKHFLGLSDNVTYFAEQLEDVTVDEYRYRVIFKPEAIVPDIDFRTSVTK